MTAIGDAITALKARLETITVANGYPLTIKSVKLDTASITFDKPVTDCPFIEIIQGPEEYEHRASGQVDITTNIILRLIHAKGKSDVDMEVFKSCVWRAIYANSYNGVQNAGITLDNTIVYPRMVRCETDLNMLEKNRIFALLLELKLNRQTWSI